ncbi:MAG: hypothetical protein K0R92_1427 [Lachnospiraceae bacterium]|jgi:hypothetical protein|nr:hypothetical protein [Lachnospiraceae bacterium]
MEQNNQWNELIYQSGIYPDALENTIETLEKRIKKVHQRRWKLSCLSSAAVFLLFIFLVNTSIVFAKGVSGIPIIGILAEFVNYNKSLSDAIHNDYVQEVNLTASNNGITLLLPYIIADENNLVLFFQIPKEVKIKEDDWFTISPDKMIDSDTGEIVKGYSAFTSAYSADNIKEYGGLTYIHYHFVEGEIPESLNINVNFSVEYTKNNSVIVDSKDSHISDPLDHPENKKDDLGTFTFQLTVDSSTFRPPITYKVHEEQVVNGQKFVIEEVTLYPTGTEVFVTIDEENTDWIKGIELEIFNENQKVLRTANGSTGSHDADGKWMNIYVESDYFNQANEKYLSIKGISLIPKDEEYVTVNLSDKTMSPQINGIVLTDVTKVGTKAHLTFDIESKDSLVSLSVFDFKYKDSKGIIYQLENQGSTSVYNNVMQNFYTVEYPEDGIIIFKRSMSPEVKLNSPIVIPLKP